MDALSKNLNELAAEIHAANEHWWRDPATGERIDRNKGELLMLVVSELSEAMEGERKDKWDDHLPHRRMAEVELADTKIRIFDFAGGFRYALVPVDTSINLPSNKADALLSIVAQIVSARIAIELGDEIQVALCLSRALAMIDTYSFNFGHDVDGAMIEKRAYNVTRADHQAEARLAANGKKW